MSKNGLFVAEYMVEFALLNVVLVIWKHFVCIYEDIRNYHFGCYIFFTIHTYALLLSNTWLEKNVIKMNLNSKLKPMGLQLLSGNICPVVNITHSPIL